MNIISHRGGARLAPENSLEAIKVSKTLGVSAAEIDIRVTKDKQLVVFHDRALTRLANQNKLVENLNLTDLQSITLKNDSKISSLSEIFKAAGDLPLVIEGKADGWATLLAGQLKEYEYKNTLSVISFSAKELYIFKKSCPGVKCLYLRIFKGFKAIRVAKRLGFDGIDVHWLGLNPLVYVVAKKSQLRIVTFTSNSLLITKLISFFYPGVDITTDQPDKLMKLTKQINSYS